MAVNLKGRSFLTLQDFTPEEIRYLLDLAELGTVIPMHQWEDYSPTERFLQKHPEQAGHVLPVTREPRSWEL